MARVTGVVTNRGPIRCRQVLQAVAGSSSLVAAMAGFRLPIHTVPLQACVSLPLKPFLNPIIVSGSLHTYIWQTSRGELVMGGATDPYGLYASRSSLEFKEGLMANTLELFPFLSEVTVLRQWAGICDMTPDFSPVMGETPLQNYYIDAGWGTGVQGDSRLRPADGPDARQWARARNPAAISAEPVRRLRAGWRKRRRVGGPLRMRR